MTDLTPRILIVLTLTLLWTSSAAAQDVPATTIRFDHRFHIEEAEVDCESCHEVEESTAALDRLLPTMETCEACHDIEDDENCVTCHLDLDQMGQIAVPPREIMFSHQGHVTLDELECLTCHKGIDSKEKTGSSHLPEMATCSTCHADERATAECVACHTNLSNLRPQSHASDWVHEHGRRVRTADATCASCHNEAECQDCHEGANISVTQPALGTQSSFSPQIRGDANLVLKRNHSLNYRFTHAMDAKGKERECATCHEPATFCAECHNPDSDPNFFRPAWHGGVNWGAIAGGVNTGGGEHARLARRDMERCAACHDDQGGDPVCLLCHLDRNVGRGNDPRTHGSRFAADAGEGEFHEDPNALCYNCHTFKGPAGGPGFCGYCHGTK